MTETTPQTYDSPRQGADWVLTIGDREFTVCVTVDGHKVRGTYKEVSDQLLQALSDINRAATSAFAAAVETIEKAAS